MRAYKNMFSPDDKIEAYMYDYNAMELTKMDEYYQATEVDFVGYIYLSKTYIKSCKYDLYMRMTHHKYFSKTVEYDIIYKNKYYHVVLDDYHTVTINGEETSLNGISYIAMLNDDLVVKAHYGNVRLEDYDGVETEAPSDFVIIEDEQISDDIPQKIKSIEVKNNNVVINDSDSYTFSEMYNYLSRVQLIGLCFRYYIPMSSIRVVNYLFGDFKIVYAFVVYSLEDLYFEYERLPNGGTVYPLIDNDYLKETYGLYYCKDNKVFLINIYDILPTDCMDEIVFLCELPDGRLVLVTEDYIYTLGNDGIFEYETEEKVSNCMCSTTEKQLRRQLILNKQL